MTAATGLGSAVAPSAPAGRPVGDLPGGTGVLVPATREWAALAALGLGLLACGTGAGHLAQHPVVGAALTVLGLAALAWSATTLRGPVRAPRASVGALLAAGPAVLLTAPLTGARPTAAEGAALVLALGAAILLALGERAAAGPAAGQATGAAAGPAADAAAAAAADHATRRAPGPLAQAAVLASGALLVALVTVPGLAATQAGAHAVPHGSHGLPTPAHHPGH